ncbi:MAG: glycogen/starch/alpha-glucan phosphorylase [Nitrospirae bacterium YQR-1]
MDAIKTSFLHHLKYTLGKDEYTATKRDCYKCIAYVARDHLIDKWLKTQQTYYDKDSKRVYYLSLEFLIGRSLGNTLVNLDIEEAVSDALAKIGYDLEEIKTYEWDPGLGNGGLGRLAACFLDSLASLEIPAYGYGIRYEYGIFFQRIRNGYQLETPDNWLRYGNPWEIERPEYLYIVKFYGNVKNYVNGGGYLRHEWVNTQDVVAVAYDTPIPGYKNNTVLNMRLWSAKSSREFELGYFQHGDYERAVSDKVQTETISKVLYPNDNMFEGKELRLKQEYFFVSATLQDIIRRYKKNHPERADFNNLSDKVAIQLNDTHPAIAIVELMRILVDNECVGWERAWEITTATFCYTNHTIMPEALERWSVHLLEKVLPRHLEIIYEINFRFLKQVEALYGGDVEKLRNMSLIEEGEEKRIRMANLSIVGSHSVNGVSALHTEILKESLFKDFYVMWPKKFNNKTNGITQRRWLRLCNPSLSALITESIGDKWVRDLTELKKLIPLSEDSVFLDKWREVKWSNKLSLAKCFEGHNRVRVDENSLFDCQFKRIHEYKRQLLNAIHVVTLYNRLKDNPQIDMVPRTVIFAGKAAPGYFMAKLIIKLINSIAHKINNDPDIKDKLRVIFVENYSVSIAETLLPAAELSEQISTAGTEASGTGNMKFALNGALTIGTLDGANIELQREVGERNFFAFGLTNKQVESLRNSGYNPRAYYDKNPVLKSAIDMIDSGYFSPEDPGLFRPIVDSLLNHGDRFLLLADFASYESIQQQVSETYKNQTLWSSLSVQNVANIGYFSSDRTIMEYVNNIWHASAVHIKI